MKLFRFRCCCCCQNVDVIIRNRSFRNRKNLNLDLFIVTRNLLLVGNRNKKIHFKQIFDTSFARFVCIFFLGNFFYFYTEKKVDGLVLTHLGWESKITFNNPNGLVLTRGFHNLFGLVLTLYDSWQFSLQRLFNRSIESTIDSLAQFFLLFILLQLIISSFSPSSN